MGQIPLRLPRYLRDEQKRKGGEQSQFGISEQQPATQENKGVGSEEQAVFQQAEAEYVDAENLKNYYLQPRIKRWFGYVSSSDPLGKKRLFGLVQFQGRRDEDAHCDMGCKVRQQPKKEPFCYDLICWRSSGGFNVLIGLA